MSAGPVDFFGARLSLQSARLDGGHPDADPVPNEHLIELEWTRVLLGVSVPVAPGWDVDAELPYDVKRVEARYELPDGTPFENPEGDLHHRDETLEGVADLRLLFNRRVSPNLFERDFLRVGAGFTLPLGKIESNPYALPLRRHQHIQFGTGTVDPLLRVDYIAALGDFSLGGGVGLRAPLYENREGYRAPTEIDASFGPTWKALSLRWSALYQTAGAWDGETDPNTGYLQQGLSLSIRVPLAPGVALVPQIARTLSIDLRGDADAFEMDWLAGLTLEVGYGAPPAPPESEASPP